MLIPELMHIILSAISLKLSECCPFNSVVLSKQVHPNFSE